MPPSLQHRNNGRKGWRMCRRALWLSVMSFIFGIALLPGCSRRRDPQAVFDHARQTLRKGDTVAAALEAERGYKDFHAAGPEWAWKFTILRARALHLRGMNEEALKLLTSEPVPPPSVALAVQELMWKGLAYVSLHKFPEAEQSLEEAEHLCA